MRLLLLTPILAIHDPKTAFEHLAKIGKEELARMRKARAEAPAKTPAQDLSFLRDIKFD